MEWKGGECYFLMIGLSVQCIILTLPRIIVDFVSIPVVRARLACSSMYVLIN